MFLHRESGQRRCGAGRAAGFRGLRVYPGGPGTGKNPERGGLWRANSPPPGKLRPREQAVHADSRSLSVGPRKREFAAILLGGFEDARIRNRGAAWMAFA